MRRSVKSRILFGFGIIILLLVVSTALDMRLLSGIDADCVGAQAALEQQSRTVEADLVMTKVRVRVNQWLRSMNPTFASQADALLAQESEFVARAITTAETDKKRQIVGDIDRTLKAYIVSWQVIRGYFAEEAQIFSERVFGPAAAIRRDIVALARLWPFSDGA